MSENEEFERFISELQAIQPSSRRRNSEAFGEAFEEIEHRLAAKVPQKSILAAFNNAYDLKVSPAGFRLLLDAERAKRQPSGHQTPNLLHAGATPAGQQRRRLDTRASLDTDASLITPLRQADSCPSPCASIRPSGAT